MSGAITIPSLELRALLKQRYPSALVWALDADYNVPAESAIAGYFEELHRELWEKYGDKWQSFFDCDNFSLEAVCLAYRKHYLARKAGAGCAQGVAFGLLCYRTDPAKPQSGHCVAFRLDGEKRVRVFEPQTRREIQLTEDQCKTVSLVFVS